MDEQKSASAYIAEGFDIMRPYIVSFVSRELTRFFKKDWWKAGVLNSLPEVYSKNLPNDGEWKDLVNKLDVMSCLHIIDSNWFDLFKYKMTIHQRNCLKELKTTRNDWAHPIGDGLKDDDASRALDTMARLMEPIDVESADDLRKLMRQVRYKTDGVSTEAPAVIKTETVTITSSNDYSRPWRQIAEPHPDVAQGKYQQAEFAADLSQVLKGTAMPEYQDPVEFFARTYITDGMRGMLLKAAQRVAGRDGEPVIQLKTSFGGGKTHSMLALYHMMRAISPNSLKGISELLNDAGITSMPKVNVAVIVGTALDPIKQRRPFKYQGITINTLWGEMAAQFAEQSGDPKLYDLIKEADKKGISPGSDTLKELFDSCAPCMVLIDELVAYARKLYGYKQGEIPAGTFENVLSFVQELTEAARKSKNSIVVASIPESETEAGGEAGMIALERIERTFGRMEAVWKPVAPEEGFEIVRRRLFRDIADQKMVDEVCNAYFEMYRSNPEDFPAECHEADYLNKMKKYYPIHPEIFDRLYTDWASIESFQRTRGVLRFMATVIHDLYINGDSGAMIMPGSIALGKTQIRDELTRYLTPGWDAIIDNEIDGRKSIPVTLDAKEIRYGKYFACKRIARTIFIGSAPDVREQRLRGINSNNIRLGVIQPKENISTYNDALSKLINVLAYLYSSPDNRFWYDTRPTLRKTAEDRARLIKNEDVLYEIEQLLKTLCRNKESFDAVHIAPKNSGDVQDQQSVRLVLLSPTQSYKNNDNIALETVKEYLEYRGTSPRMYRNMVTFIAPDGGTIELLKQDMKKLMSWRSIENESDVLNLDNAQKKEIKNEISKFENKVKDEVLVAYSWLLIPMQEGTKEVTWSHIRITGAISPVKKAAQKLKEDEYLIDAFSPKILLMEIEQYNLWKDRESISVHELWEDYSRYLYLHRLSSYDVLLNALKAGVLGKYFGYAYGQDSYGKYENLCIGETGHLHITKDGIIVKPDVALNQIEKEKAEKETHISDIEDIPESNLKIKGIDTSSHTTDTIKIKNHLFDIKKKSTHFYGSVEIDANKLGSTAGTINQEVLQHLGRLNHVEVTVKLDIDVKIPEGAPDDVVRTVLENCRTLKFETSEFD